jgi:hypothetical protein
VLYASTPRSTPATRDASAQPQVPATGSRVRSWILVAMIVVSAIAAAAIVGHAGPEVVVPDASVARG